MLIMSEKTQAEYVREWRDKQLASITPCEPRTSYKYYRFHEGWYEHVADDPIYFKSKKELRDYTRAHGMTSDYAE